MGSGTVTISGVAQPVQEERVWHEGDVRCTQRQVAKAKAHAAQFSPGAQVPKQVNGHVGISAERAAKVASFLRDKSVVVKIFLVDYICILIAYVGLGMASLLAFGGLPDNPSACPPSRIIEEPQPCPVQSVITKNFESFSFAPLAYYLSLYPVFALTTNFPLIAITLRNNLMTIIPFRGVKRFHCTLLAVLPPYAIAFLYRDVDSLAGITGGFAGVFIQLIIPAMLAILARRWEAANVNGAGRNVHKSPFSSDFWPKLVLVWAALCLAANTYIDVRKLL